MDFSRLEKSIMDVIKEEQAKLGYRKEKIRLYYPLSSLNHFFQVEGDVTGMLEKLNWFSEYTKQRLGQVEVTNEGERFCFHIPEEGVEYVHEQMKENEFIKELIGLGGSTTALAVNINTYPTHIAGLPVAVNICCHVNRHVVKEL